MMSQQPRLGIQEAADLILRMTGADKAMNAARDTTAQALNAHRIAREIYDSENARTKAQILKDRPVTPRPGDDDMYDAMRHAEASRRISEALGPGYAHLFGTAHEVQNLLTPRNWLEGNILERVGMDLRNNAEGRLAWREGRAIDPSRLQTSLAPGRKTANGYNYKRGLNF